MKKVLLTSERKSFLDRNSDFLLRRGFQLFTATRAADAFQLHNKHHFDLIITDHKLEDMSGYAFCKLINSPADSVQTPVIIVCQNRPESLRTATESKASAVLPKPVDPKKLLTAITAFIDLQVVKSRRIALNVPVLCRKPGAELCCLSRDISNTGILVESDQLAVGSRVNCELTLPDANHVEAEGEVVRKVRTPGGESLCGIKFTSTPISSLRTIISYVVAKATAAPHHIVPLYPGQTCLSS